MKYKRSSLWRNFVGLAIVLISATLAVNGFFRVESIQNTELSRLNDDAEAALKRLALSLVVPVWNLNLGDAETVLRGEMLSPAISAAGIADKAGTRVLTLLVRSNSEVVKPSNLDSFPKKGDINLESEIKQGDEVIGVVKLEISKALVLAQVRTQIISEVIQIVILDVLLGLMMAVLLGFFVTRPLSGLDRILLQISQGEGDLTVRLPVRSGNEIGRLSERFNTFIAKLAEMVSGVIVGVQTLAVASGKLSSISKEVSSDSEAVGERAGVVSAATEEMNSNMSTVSAAMEQTSRNLQTVATAAEEMTSTIGEIASNSGKAREMTEDAVAGFQNVGTAMKVLSSAADEIGRFIETIASISSQTNLLALNSTIEAARAGQAGKGFAVVALEIKELSRQTATATEDIKARITSIQDSTSSVVKSVSGLSETIGHVNALVSGIAVSIEEQSSVTKDIAQNILQASRAVEETSLNVSQATTTSSMITRDIAGVDQSSGKIVSSSAQVMTNSQELSELAEGLRVIVGKFKV